MSHRFHDLTFTSSVKELQEKYGSRSSYARSEGGDPNFHGMGDAERGFIGQRESFYMATVNNDGQPYIQFRGGAEGFLKVLDDKTLGFADFRGNMQFISIGNLRENSKAALFLMDYPNQARLKMLVDVEVKEAAEDPELMKKLTVEGYKAKNERAMILHVEAFDWNCQQHIPQRFTVEEVKQIVAPMSAELDKLQNENLELKKLLKKHTE